MVSINDDFIDEFNIKNTDTSENSQHSQLIEELVSKHNLFLVHLRKY